MYAYFNSRPREEVDVSKFDWKNFWEHFNSRPREEVDQHLLRLEVL